MIEKGPNNVKYQIVTDNTSRLLAQSESSSILTSYNNKQWNIRYEMDEECVFINK